MVLRLVLFVCLFRRQVLILYSSLACTSLCGPSWPRTHDNPPASVSPMLGSQECSLTPRPGCLVLIKISSVHRSVQVSQPDSFPSHLGRGPRSVSRSPSRWGRRRDARGGSRKGVLLTPRRPPAAPAFCADRGVRWGRRPRQARPGRPSSAQSAGSCPEAGAPHPCSSKRRISGWGAGKAAGSGRGRGLERVPRTRACWSDTDGDRERGHVSRGAWGLATRR